DSGATGSEPIVLQISNEPSHVIGFLGIWDCGAVAVPLHVGAAATERPRTICLTACQSPAPSVVASLRDRDSAARSSRPRGAGARGVKKDHDRHVVTLARGTGDDRGGAHPYAFLNFRADHGARQRVARRTVLAAQWRGRSGLDATHKQHSLEFFPY